MVPSGIREHYGLACSTIIAALTEVSGDVVGSIKAKLHLVSLLPKNTEYVVHCKDVIAQTAKSIDQLQMRLQQMTEPSGAGSPSLTMPSATSLIQQRAQLLELQTNLNIVETIVRIVLITLGIIELKDPRVAQESIVKVKTAHSRIDERGEGLHAVFTELEKALNEALVV